MKKRGSLSLLIVITLLLLVNINLILCQEDELKVTDEHPFFVDGKWIIALQLKVGDELTTADGKKAKITEIEDVVVDENEGVEVYNLEALPYNDFVVDGEVVVHNSNPPKCIDNFLVSCNDPANCPLKICGGLPFLKTGKTSDIIDIGDLVFFRFDKGDFSYNRIGKVINKKAEGYLIEFVDSGSNIYKEPFLIDNLKKQTIYTLYLEETPNKGDIVFYYDLDWNLQQGVFYGKDYFGKALVKTLGKADLEVVPFEQLRRLPYADLENTEIQKITKSNVLKIRQAVKQVSGDKILGLFKVSFPGMLGMIHYDYNTYGKIISAEYLIKSSNFDFTEKCDSFFIFYIDPKTRQIILLSKISDVDLSPSQLSFLENDPVQAVLINLLKQMETSNKPSKKIQDIIEISRFLYNQCPNKL